MAKKVGKKIATVSESATTRLCEEWRAIPGYEGLYEVSDCGRVRSLDTSYRGQFRRGRILRQNEMLKGYLLVVLSKDNERRSFRVHRLVAAAFCEQPPGCDEVNHLDGDKRNNAASNLEWATSSVNKLHAIDLGLYAVGEAHYKAVLTADLVRRIRQLVAEGWRKVNIARELGLNVATVKNVAYGTAWKSVK